ncbi:MAG: ribosome recycling factor [Nitrospinota bacterium]|nr:ribosome recycling factor [Nitrospinota bacterium]
MEGLFKDCQRKMEISIDHLRQELNKLRTGSANSAILEGLKIDYYGTPTPLNQVATVGVPNSQTIIIQPWDISILKDLEKAILVSDLGLMPNNDGRIIRLNIPPLTGERRQQLVKVLKKSVEDGKVAIRNVRRDFNEKLKSMEKKHEISEDDSRKGLEKLQKITDECIKEAEKLSDAKEKDILNV